MDIPAGALVAAEAEPGAQALGIRNLESRDARLWLIAAADRYAETAGLPRRTGDAAFAALWRLGKLDVPAWVRDAVADLSPRTLGRWREHVRVGDATGLAVDKGAARRGKGALDAPEIRDFILALVASQPHLTAHHVRGCVEGRFPGFAAPPVRTFQHVLKSLKQSQKVLLTKVTNPDLFRSAYRSSGTGSREVSRLNELWEIDASPADALCVDGRYSVYVCVDVWSRRIVIQVMRTACSGGVALLMRRAILAWGVPEIVKTDQGSDFLAKATQRLIAALRIEPDVCAAFSPEQKPHVERAIGTMQRGLMPLLPGFIGHNVKDRKRIEERRAFAARLGQDDAHAFAVQMTARELQGRCDQWAAGVYAHHRHSNIGFITPAAKAASWTGKVRRVENVRALDLLLAPIAGSDGMRTVTKTGLRIDNSHYLFAAALPGTQVFVRMDPLDMGRAYVFEAGGETFLGEAICPELAGVDPAAAAAMAKLAQKALLAEGERRLRAGMNAIKPRDMAKWVLERPEYADAEVVEFPKQIEGYATPALDAAAEAVAPQTPLSLPAPAASSARPPAGDARVARLPETPHQRFRRALDHEAEVAAGVAIATADALWLGGYRTGSEYRAMRELCDDFGEEALGI